MAESSSTSTATVAKGASVREAIDSLNKWRHLSPIERPATPFPDVALETLIAYAGHALNKERVNSSTSGVPPSQDQNRPRGSKRRDKGKRKPGGQTGHKGTTTEWCEHPGVCVDCAHDFSRLPEGHIYRAEAPVMRQSIDVVFTKVVAEFRLERFSVENNRLYAASIDWSRTHVLYMAFASGVPVPLSCAGAGMTAVAAGHGFSATLTVPFGRLSCGLTVRALAIELNVMQMLPLARESELFKKHLGLTLSQAS